MPFCIPAFGHLRRFFCSVGLHQSRQGFFADEIIRPGLHQIHDHADDVPGRAELAVDDGSIRFTFRNGIEI